MQTTDKEDIDEFSKKVEEKAERKLKAINNDKKSIWFGLGMMGLVGWTIVVPTILGALLGIWLDKKYPDTISWTLSGLILGLLIGCIVAWRWINKEQKEINKNNDDDE